MGCSWCDGAGELALTLSDHQARGDTSTGFGEHLAKVQEDPTERSAI